MRDDLHIDPLRNPELRAVIVDDGLNPLGVTWRFGDVDPRLGLHMPWKAQQHE
jgi:hypothetical protein